ncbi:MAG: class I SAM-dependent methyltransferase [Halobacteriaceae archaeon]
MDKSELLAEQYADASNLSTRGEFNERYTVKDRHPHEWVRKQVSLPTDARVLDIGCGPGTFWTVNNDQIPPEWEVVLGDFSRDMVTKARNRVTNGDLSPHITVADAERLPFDANSFDAILALQMLYHLPDIENGLQGLREVLRPDGCLYASAGSPHNAELLFEMMSTVVDGSVETISNGFTNENGYELLNQYFDHVEQRIFENEIRVEDPDAVVSYALSLPLDDPALEPFDPEDAEELRAVVAEYIDRHGEIRWQKDYPLFIAKP